MLLLGAEEPGTNGRQTVQYHIPDVGHLVVGGFLKTVQRYTILLLRAVEYLIKLLDQLQLWVCAAFLQCLPQRCKGIRASLRNAFYAARAFSMLDRMVS